MDSLRLATMKTMFCRVLGKRVGGAGVTNKHFFLVGVTSKATVGEGGRERWVSPSGTG